MLGLALAVLAAPARSQGPSAEEHAARPNHVWISAGWLGASAGYAHRTGTGTELGLELGLGGDGLNGMVASGGHYSSGTVLDVIHLGALVRTRAGGWMVSELGVRAGFLAHSGYGSTYLEPLLVARGAFLYDARFLRIGPRIQAGLFNDELGVNVGLTAVLFGQFAW